MHDLLSATYASKRVLITGHTGFKGTWMALWLAKLGAHVTGYALEPGASPAMFAATGVGSRITHVAGDIRDRARLRQTLNEAAPDFVFHMAAQALVRTGIRSPVDTFETNTLGTTYLLDSVRERAQPVVVVVVTSDKCYEPSLVGHPHIETDHLGGRDPYSASKAAAEIVARAYRDTFFPPKLLPAHGIAIATARAGNCFGGGDWAEGRLVPDVIRALTTRTGLVLRRPDSVRPWQHVLEPLGGYLLLAATIDRATAEEREALCTSWNFGPRPEGSWSVVDLVRNVVEQWGAEDFELSIEEPTFAETDKLELDASKARRVLGWKASWDLRQAVVNTVEWYRAFYAGVSADALSQLSLDQIDEYARTSPAASG